MVTDIVPIAGTGLGPCHHQVKRRIQTINSCKDDECFKNRRECGECPTEPIQVCGWDYFAEEVMHEGQKWMS